MLLFVLAYLGGVLTIASPCILPWSCPSCLRGRISHVPCAADCRCSSAWHSGHLLP